MHGSYKTIEKRNILIRIVITCSICSIHIFLPWKFSQDSFLDFPLYFGLVDRFRQLLVNIQLKIYIILVCSEVNAMGKLKLTVVRFSLKCAKICERFSTATLTI